ncbi:MAG: glycoside hydrolase family 31 protein [Lachnospiraceae bacterium]|nr:glycoside hydrolase family 31 protein [Lachnospiraceae bacterium]
MDQKPFEYECNGGKLQITACYENVIRVRWSPNGGFQKKDFHDDRYSTTFTDPNRKSCQVELKEREEEDGVLLATAQIRLHIDRKCGRITYCDAQDVPYLREKKRAVGATIELDGKTYYQLTQQFASPEKERLFGFGNIGDRLGIKGETVTIRQDNTEKRTPMFVSNMGYGILFDITSNGLLDWEEDNRSYSYTGKCTDSMDYYVFYGPQADAIIGGYRRITGRAVMLPEHAFGFIQSRNRYTSCQEVQQTVEQFRRKQIPLDTIVIDYRWWDDTWFNNFSVLGLDYEDMEHMLKCLHEQHVSVAISVWPTAIKKEQNPTYRKLTDSDEQILLAHGSDFGLPYDASKKAYRSTYWNLLNTSVFSKGIDSIWLDANEPEMGNWCEEIGEMTALGSSKPMGLIYPLLDNKAVYEGQRAVVGNKKRVNTLSRGAVAGTQRYGIQSWSGDIPPGFAQLSREVIGVLNYASAGLPYFSTDTGGYFGIDVCDPAVREMFLRWLQFSTFVSIMRVHGCASVREPWQFGEEYEAYITEYIRLRESLVPYTYSLAGRVTQEGYTIVRPLVFDYRTDDVAVNIQDQFMFGPAFLVAPVCEEGVRNRSVYLPKGAWINYWTGEIYRSGGEQIYVDAPLTQIPLFVRAGSIVPRAMGIQHAREAVDAMEIHVYPGADGTFVLYEDEGNGYAYEHGGFSEIVFSWCEEDQTLTIGKRKGSFYGMSETRTFTLHLLQAAEDGKLSGICRISVRYEGEEITIRDTYLVGEK